MSPIDPTKISMQHSNSTSKVHNVNDDEIENVTIQGANNSNSSNIKIAGSNVLLSVGGYLDNNYDKNPIVGNINGNANNYIPHNIFNNNNGMMSINIEHRHIYGGRTVFDNNKKVNRKIEFTNKEFNTAPMSTFIESENLNSNRNIYANSSNFKGRINKPLKKYENYTEDKGASSEDITVEDIPFDSETLVKPQPIVGRNFTNLNNDVINHGSIYINPYYKIQDSSSYSEHHQPIFYPACNLNPAFQMKIQEESNKKKFSCSCKKSKCLKLYCECFANGEYCINCNCNDCSNVIGNEPEREDALKLIKDKNPVAIKLQVIKEEESETKIGCNCTKSNCSKKYCECYKANLKCSEICRCRDCGNASERLKHHMLMSGFKKDFSKFDNLNNEIYNYNEFSIEKISVLIENKKIFINKRSYKDLEKLKFLAEKTSSDQSEYNEIPNQGEDRCDFQNKTNISSNLVVKREQNSILIQISKCILNFDHSLGLIQTPNKFRKRNRRSSLDSYNTTNNVSISEYNKFTKTACETSKKINVLTKIPNNIGKKLILDDGVSN